MAVNLSKGQRISLEKTAGSKLTRVVMGLGWDARQAKGLLGGLFGGGAKKEIDLDASVLLFDANKQSVDAVWFRQLKSRDGSITHTGDNRTGAGEGDDEQIIVELAKVPATVMQLVFVVCSFRGDTFNEIENAYCRLLDGTSNKEIARYTLTGGGSYTAQVMARVFRSGNEWEMQAIGAPTNGRVFQDMMPEIVKHLG